MQKIFKPIPLGGDMGLVFGLLLGQIFTWLYQLDFFDFYR